MQILADYSARDYVMEFAERFFLMHCKNIIDAGTPLNNNLFLERLWEECFRQAEAAYEARIKVITKLIGE